MMNNLEPIHRLLVPEVYVAFKTSLGGLTEEEAALRLEQYGKNEIQQVKAKPLWVRFLENFTHLMAILLWVGGFIGFLAKLPQIGVAIWMVNLINGVFSFLQEYKAEKATEALKKLLPTYVKVIRQGDVQKRLAEELVPGDVILLEEGDLISADARLVEETEFTVNQSTLSGESRPAKKTSEAVFRQDLTRTELPNLIFAGTTVATGSAKAVVIATGMESEFGKIAHLTQTVGDELSPLQKELGRVTKNVSMLATLIGVVFFVLSVFVAHVSVVESFIFALGMIVAFIPEGMLPTVTLSLAMGVQRMAHKRALIKRLSAVETLGSTTVICTDKTGTLTQNEMTVTDIWLPGNIFKVTGTGYAPRGEIIAEGAKGSSHQDDLEQDDLRLLFRTAYFCNNSRLIPPEAEEDPWTILGDPTEAALKVVALKYEAELGQEQQGCSRIRELPFDSHRKRMSTIYKKQNQNLIFVKGAPKEVLGVCTHFRQAGEDQMLDEASRATIIEANDNYARKGLRVLAFAYREVNEVSGVRSVTSTYSAEIIEQGLTFLGLMAMMDPPRPEVAAAIQKCHSAGIRIIMITGDYGLTAESIARRIGAINSPDPKIVTGIELDAMDEKALSGALEKEVIFARVAPEHKLRVVSALKEMGEVVAVTGDGVNDAPALKKADIGVSMGIAGTDVAKEAADVILTDDNFASIVYAIEEGRAVYTNIQKFLVYIFTSNMAEAVPFALFLFSGGSIPLPLTVMQVLAIDLGTDMLPAIGLGAEPPEEGLMSRPPRSKGEPLLNIKLLGKAMLWYGVLEALASFSAYLFVNWHIGWPAIPLAREGTNIYKMATTMSLSGVVAAQVASVLNCRSDRSSIFRMGLFSNRLILWGILVEFAVLTAIIYIPFLQPVFNTAPIGIQEWAFLLVWIPIILLMDEMRKLLLRMRKAR